MIFEEWIQERRIVLGVCTDVALVCAYQSDALSAMVSSVTCTVSNDCSNWAPPRLSSLIAEPKIFSSQSLIAENLIPKEKSFSLALLVGWQKTTWAESFK